jgi:hypothetical protein
MQTLDKADLLSEGVAVTLEYRLVCSVVCSFVAYYFDALRTLRLWQRDYLLID